MAAVWVPLIRLVEIMGRGPAHTLATEFAGRAFYVTKKITPRLLSACSGDAAAAAALSREYGGTDILLPTGLIQPPSKKERILGLLGTGSSRREIARICGSTTRYVGMVARDAGL